MCCKCNIRRYAAVTPSNTTILGADTLYVSTAGVVVFEDAAGNQATLNAVAGNYLYGQFYRVRLGTTATVLACYGA